MVGQGFGGDGAARRSVHCADNEWVTFQPPNGRTCGEYAGEWVSSAYGTLANLEAREDCRYCRYKVGDGFLETLGMKYVP